MQADESRHIGKHYSGERQERKHAHGNPPSSNTSSEDIFLRQKDVVEELRYVHVQVFLDNIPSRTLCQSESPLVTGGGAFEELYSANDETRDETIYSIPSFH